MRKRNVKEELLKYPCYLFENGKLEKIQTPNCWHGLHLHHFITTQWEQKNPKKFAQVAHLQKLIFLPPDMHMDLHNKNRNFKEKYGIEIKELLFNWKEYDMISADKAREKTEINNLNLTRDSVEKLIKKAIDKGRRDIFYTGNIPQVIIDEIKGAGYDVEVTAAGIKIIW